MKHDELIDGSLRAMGHEPGFISAAEREAIRDVLMAGEKHGFGNMISWLATGWAAMLRANGLDEKSAIAQASNRSGYPLPADRMDKAGKSTGD